MASLSFDQEHALPLMASGQLESGQPPQHNRLLFNIPRGWERRIHMSSITVTDGTRIYYKDWGKGPFVTFSHGWPLSSDAWDGQLLFFAQNGFRAVAHDRRGHGRSSQPSSGNDMDGYADDLAAVIEAL